MFKNYLITAYKVYTRRKLFTAINLLCITLTLTVLLVVTALLQNAFFPRGVEGKSDRFLQLGTWLDWARAVSRFAPVRSATRSSKNTSSRRSRWKWWLR